MPVLGQEETGVKSFAEQFSGFIAGVPIKKRRFPQIHPSSTLSEEPCSLTKETELLQEEQVTSEGPTLSNANIAGVPIKKRRFLLIQASSPLAERCSLSEENDALCKEHPSISQGSTLSTSSFLSDTIRTPAFEERKTSTDVTDVNMVQSNSKYLKPKLEEPNLATRSSILGIVDSKEKLIKNESYGENLGPQMMKKNSELLLAAKESLALNMGADITKQNVEDKCKEEDPAFPDSTNLSSGLKQHLFPAVASLDVDKSFQKTEKEESVSLNFSLSKECSSKSLNGDTKTDRANWDLNTTMDVWEESGSDVTLGKISVHGPKHTGSVLNEKHLMCSTGMEPTGSASLKQTSQESQNKAFIISSRLDGQQYKCVDPHNIRLASHFQKYIGEPSRFSVKQNSDSALPTLSLSNPIASAGDMNIACVRRVKSEPLDENPKRVLKEAKPSAVGSLDALTVKQELAERPNVESFKSMKGSNMKLLETLLIKSEPGNENIQERPKMTESKSDQMAAELPRRSDNCFAMEKPVTLQTVPVSAETACPPVKAICLVELSTNGSTVSHIKNHVSTEGACIDAEASLGSCSAVEKPVTLQTAPVSAETDCPPAKAICSAELSTNGSIVSHIKNHAYTLGACVDAEASQGSCSTIEKPVTLQPVPASAETACPPVKAVCSVALSSDGSIMSHLKNHASTEGACVDAEASWGLCSSDKQVRPETVAIAMPDNATESCGPGMKDSIRTNEENAGDTEGCRLKLMNEHLSDPRGSAEGCVSDDEKITFSADLLEDDSYGLDYGSDGTNSLTAAMDIEHCGEEYDDYEDGEVREPLKQSLAENSICEVREVNCIACSYDDSNQIVKGMVSRDCSTSSHVEDDNRAITHNEINCGKDGVDTESKEKSDNVTDKIVCPQESSEAEKPTVGLQMMSFDLSVRKKASESELLSDQGTNESQEVDVTECADEVVKNLDMVRKNDSDLTKMEATVNTDDATKDVCNGSNQGRIINLSRAANSSSPTKSRPISGWGLPSQAGRDVLTDAFGNDKLHRGRDEVYIDGPCKFSRERHQDMSPRNSRLNYVHGRGRFNSRLDTHRGGWESEREFAGEFSGGPSQFRASRHKYASTVHDGDLEYNNIASDGSYVGAIRANRKPLTDERPLGHHINSRRWSPGGRESMQMGHRFPRTMSPSRCIGGGGSELVGMRHSEKFMREFPEDPLDPMYTRPRPFERQGGRFTRGRRNFSSIQRRGPPRMHSKSPVRSRSRSPSGPWPSPRRRSPGRSPDGFGGHPELAHQRSPLYTVDRMRCPDRPVFRAERVVRRRVSPSYIRDIDSGRNHCHPRSVISNRGPSGRILLRNRRFDVVDPQDRADTDEYFGGPTHSGRLLEPNSEGNGGERRRFGERRGPVRPFRPPYNDNAGENFHLDAEDGPRHFRFCADDSDFHERGNLRERDFDRRIKGRPANGPPRRTRNTDDQEANFRNGGQVWSDDGYDDISRVKRKRF